MKQKTLIPGQCTPEQCLLGNTTVLHTLEHESLNELSINTGSYDYDRGEMVFYGGDVSAGLYVIGEGKVRIFKVGAHDREQVVRLAHKGDILGYRSLIVNEPHTTFAEAIEPSRICFVPRPVFQNLLAKDPRLQLRLMTLLADDLREAEQHLTALANKPVDERIADALLWLASAYGYEDDGVTIAVRMTRAELANVVGTAMETVSRHLTKLQRHAIVALDGQRISITNRLALARAANPRN